MVNNYYKRIYIKVFSGSNSKTLELESNDFLSRKAGNINIVSLAQSSTSNYTYITILYTLYEDNEEL
jgi:hypothetical protein